jgi:cytoskeletal protein RodZ
MENPGEYLKREREQRGVPLNEISARTRVPMKYLLAIEADDFDSLPSATFVKGFIRSYCKHLGLDDTDALLRYEMFLRERAETGEGAEKALKGPAAPPFSWNTRNLTAALIAAGLVVIVVVYIFSSRGADEERSVVARAPEAATEPEKAPVALPETVVAPAPEAPPAQVAPPKPKERPKEKEPPLQAEAPREAPPVATAVTPAERPVEPRHTLVITAVEVAWIKVRIDGGEPFDVILREGEKVVWKAQETFSLLVGNAGGVEAVYDGTVLPRLGESGKSVSLELPPRPAPGQ